MMVIGQQDPASSSTHSSFIKRPASVLEQAALEDRWRQAEVQDKSLAFMMKLESLVDLAVGLAAILLPATIPLPQSKIFGFVFLVSSLVPISRTYTSSSHPGVESSLVSGVGSFILGVILVAYSSELQSYVRWMLWGYFWIQGFGQLWLAWQLKGIRYGTSLFLPGMLALTLGTLILLGIPGNTHFWWSSVLLGAHRLVTGFLTSLIAIHCTPPEAASPLASSTVLEDAPLFPPPPPNIY
jgi:hypothetical protein